MIAVDFWGAERAVKTRAPKPTMASLFDLAAEQTAIATGKPLSQTKLEIIHGDEPAAWYCRCGTSLGSKPFARCTGCEI